mgnify:CR=1 FL=1|tara:strand:- start:4122 stop:4772 length:651 start_codon:yes stop_codon:yes gene_type:complete
MKIVTKNNQKLSGAKKTREHILDVSAKLFSKRGYNGTPLRDIAAAVNMKAGSLYYHFDSKEQLILEILTIGTENIYESVVGRVAELPANSSSRSILLAAAKGHLEALLEKGDYTSTGIRNYGQLPKPIQSKVLLVRDKYEDLWRGWLSEAKEKGDISANVDLKILRLTILGALNRTLEWYKKGKFSVEEIAEMQFVLFWDGVAKKRTRKKTLRKSR